MHAGKQQSFYNLVLSFPMGVARNVQSTQNRKLVIFLQYPNKQVSQLFLCSIVIINIQIFQRGPVMFVVTCYYYYHHYRVVTVAGFAGKNVIFCFCRKNWKTISFFIIRCWKTGISWFFKRVLKSHVS